jgi:hypothetical protein
MGSIHKSDIDDFKAHLKSIGFKNKPLCSWEYHRMEHPELGKVIIWRGYTNHPFPKMNDNGTKLFKEFKHQQKEKEGE